MKRDEFASINNVKKKGTAVFIVIAIAAVCLAGILCAVKLRAESGAVFMDTGSIKITGEEKNNG